VQIREHSAESAATGQARSRPEPPPFEFTRSLLTESAGVPPSIPSVIGDARHVPTRGSRLARGGSRPRFPRLLNRVRDDRHEDLRSIAAEAASVPDKWRDLPAYAVLHL